MACKCRQCLPVVDGIRHTDTPRNLPAVHAPFIEKLDDVMTREVAAGVRKERQRCAEIVALYPLEGFCYDTNNHGEILRLRDTISEAILKSVAGEGLK